MASYHVMVRLISTGPQEHHAIVSAISSDGGDAEVRRDVLKTPEEAKERCDYLVGLLCSELRAQGHEIVKVDGDGH